MIINKMDHHKTLNQPPIQPFPPVCFTCNKPIAVHWLKYVRKRLESTDGKNTDLPLRIINEDDIMGNSYTTIEKKILDDLGIIRYCCRRMILGQPMAEVPPPPENEPLPGPTFLPEEKK